MHTFVLSSCIINQPQFQLFLPPHAHRGPACSALAPVHFLDVHYVAWQEIEFPAFCLKLVVLKVANPLHSATSSGVQHSCWLLGFLFWFYLHLALQPLAFQIHHKYGAKFRWRMSKGGQKPQCSFLRGGIYHSPQVSAFTKYWWGPSTVAFSWEILVNIKEKIR